MTDEEKARGYEIALRHQERECARNYSEQERMIRRHTMEAVRLLGNFNKALGQNRKARGLGGYLSSAMQALNNAMLAHMHLVHFQQVGKNPFLVAPAAPVEAENDETLCPVNMEAPEPEKVEFTPEDFNHTPVKIRTFDPAGAKILIDGKHMNFAEGPELTVDAIFVDEDLPTIPESIAQEIDREILGDLYKAMGVANINTCNVDAPDPEPPASAPQRAQYEVEVPD